LYYAGGFAGNTLPWSPWTTGDEIRVNGIVELA
jgi:hypothetical protein